MSKFTPGPWEAKKDSSRNLYHYHILDKNSTSLAVVSERTLKSLSRDLPIVDANAKLIAKAPKMYDMIEDLRKVLITIYDTNHMAPMIDRYLRDIKELQNQIKGE